MPLPIELELEYIKKTLDLYHQMNANTDRQIELLLKMHDLQWDAINELTTKLTNQANAILELQQWKDEHGTLKRLESAGVV